MQQHISLERFSLTGAASNRPFSQPWDLMGCTYYVLLTSYVSACHLLFMHSFQGFHNRSS